jgi:hypothetical protein
VTGQFDSAHLYENTVAAGLDLTDDDLAVPAVVGARY